MTDEPVEKLDPTRTQGLVMVASYRAERSLRRDSLRDALRKSHAALRAARQAPRGQHSAGAARGEHPAPPAPEATLAEAPARVPLVVVDQLGDLLLSPPVEAASVFAHLVDAPVAEPSEPPVPSPDIPAAPPLPAATHRLAAVSEAPPAPLETTEELPAVPEITEAEAVVPVDVAPDEAAPEDTAPEETALEEAALEEAAQEAMAPEETAPEEAAAANTTPAAEPEPPEPGLTNVTGFGPGIVLRLQQLGYTTAADLADADPERLRQALGNISRLVDVDTWIANARKLRSR